ncbi:hypothetical protein [Endozoicomonas sp. ALB032]|uniref:hypothetical protein n=2 Tax=Endozoicomonas TaxID=305899 RepID=UPI003BB5C75F
MMSVFYDVDGFCLVLNKNDINNQHAIAKDLLLYRKPTVSGDKNFNQLPTMIYGLVSLVALMMVIFIWNLLGWVLSNFYKVSQKGLESMKNKFTLMILMATLAISAEAVSETCDIVFAHNRVNISTLDKAELLAALYNRAKPQGLGMLHYDPAPMTVDQAKELLSKRASHELYFDYLAGRVMKIDISSDVMKTRLYNRDNGENAAEKVACALKPSKKDEF